MKKKETLLIILLCFVSRLPQLLGGNLMLDGDESVVGLMAKHLYEGKKFPVFFYGQSYGFSFIELLSIDLHYFLFGISGISVKLAMLLIWTSGIIFFYKTLTHLHLKNGHLPFLMTLIFIFSPAWAVWSMKARGGYLTSFLLTFIITSLLFNEKPDTKKWTWLVTGFLLVLIYQSQPLWLPGLLPIVLYKFYRSDRKHTSISVLTGLFTGMILFYFLKYGIISFWNPYVFSFPGNIWKAFVNIPYQIFLNISGSFHSDIPSNVIAFTDLWAICFTVFIIVVPFIILFLFVRKKIRNSLLILFLIATVFSLSYAPFLRDFDARYLLPLTGYFLLMVCVFADNINFKIIFNLISILFILFGSLSLYTFRYFRYETFKKENIENLIDVLVSRNIHYVFCTNPLLQWEITFYSKEKVKARYYLYKDRYPEYVRSVNNAFYSKKEKVAVTGMLERCSPYWEKKIVIDDLFFINEDPNALLLSYYGFDMNYSGH